jgi:hypothetical protein
MAIDYMGPGFGGNLHRVRSAGHDIGRPYEPVTDLGEALVLWGKHLVADFIGDTNLPLSGWTKLYELDNRYLRKFAHETYGNGVNLRPFAISTLPVMTTEITVRTHTHGRAMITRQTAKLEPGETALRAELLLAGHALVGAASLG